MECCSPRLRIERSDEAVRQAVVALIRRRGLDVEAVAADVGIPLDAWRRRLVSSGSSYAFTAGEVRTLAEYFGIEGVRCSRTWTVSTRQPRSGGHAVAAERHARC